MKKRKKYREVLWFIIDKEKLAVEDSRFDEFYEDEKEMAEERLEWKNMQEPGKFRLCKVLVKEI